jgi:hypothetical protein
MDVIFPIRAVAIAVSLCVFASCSHGNPGDEVYSRRDGKLIGTVIEKGNHSYENGLSAPSIHYHRASDGADIWASRDTFDASYEMRKKK